MVPADVTLTPGTAPTTTSGGIVMNPDGTITVAPGTPAGTYSYPYTICENLNPSNCDTATATVVVDAAPIVANDDTVTGVNGTTGAANVVNAYTSNDTLNGAGITDVSTIVGTVVTPATPINGGAVPTLDTATGNVSVPAGTPAGSYTITYQICETLNPSNCDTAVITVAVVPPAIDAVDDTPAPINGATGGTTGSVLVNDTLNGAPVVPADVTLTPGTAPTTTSGGIVMNPDGTITVAPGTPAGTYSYPYTICENLNPSNCDTATVAVVVTPPAIIATPDPVGPINGSTGNPNAGNVLTNDTINGQPVTPGNSTVTVTTPATPVTPGAPVPSVDPSTGVISVPPGTPAGEYTVTYEICDKLNPTNCATSTVTVTVVPPAIDAVDDTPAPINGATGNPNAGNVLTNDTLNGQPVTPSNVTTTVTTPATPMVPGATVPSIDPATGIISVPAGTPGADYTITYQICEKLNPTNCDTATVTVKVEFSQPKAIDDAAQGEAGKPLTIAILANDDGNGASLDPTTVRIVGAAGDGKSLTVPGEGTWTVNANGTLTFTPEVGFAGEATPIQYSVKNIYGTESNAANVNVTILSDTQIRMTKTASPRDVKVGDLVRYTVVAENVGKTDVKDGLIIDTPPAGFTLVDGSIQVADDDAQGRVVGTSPIQIDRIDIKVGGRATITYLLRVGAGVRGGTHSNSAMMKDDGKTVSNTATADVQLVSDPMADTTLILGTVFDDRDGDGYQDSAELSEVRVQGGFAPSAYIANSTTVDRGAGPQPEPDASSPMLHGIKVGNMTARQSDADPIKKHQVMIRQRLSALDFTNDFVLTNAQGVTVRMAADGSTSTTKSGDASKGTTAAAPMVARSVAKIDGGYEVTYTISNVGVDERGIPGVRIASVEGLIMETDQYGRYHLAGTEGGPWERGRNFILKVDPSTLPRGAEFTTDNPLVRRITPGLPTRFDFGVKMPKAAIEGGKKDVEIELGTVIFQPGSSTVEAKYDNVIGQIAAKVDQYRGGDLLIAANGESDSLAVARANAVDQAVRAKVSAESAANLKVSVRTDVADPHSLVVATNAQGLLMGTVLFDTDKSNIRPEFESMLDQVAHRLEEMNGGVIALVGHTDQRASHAYNTALGLRRSTAVYEALKKRLSPELLKRVKVDTSSDTSAPAR